MAYTPYSYVQLKADGATTNFPFNFPYLDTAHIQVSVDTVVTDFTWVDSYTIKIASAPVAGAVVEIRRITPKDSAIVSFQDGSTLLEADLDLMVTYNLYCAQEAYDGTQASIHLTADGVWDGQGVRATAFADPVDAQDLMTLNYMNANFRGGMLDIQQITATYEEGAAESASKAYASQQASAASEAAAKISEANAADSEQKAAGFAAGVNLPSASGEALRLLRQKADESGLEYGPRVQSAPLDATVGALMAVGAFGLGALSGLEILSNIDTMNTPSGIYRWLNTGGGTAPSSYGVVLVCGHNGNTAGNNWEFQLFFSTDGYVSFRYSINLEAWSTWRRLYDASQFDYTKFPKSGGTLDMTGTRFDSGATTAMASVDGNSGMTPLTIGNETNSASSAIMTFIRDGQFACHLGIDTDNVFKVGGWSMGANAYPILHTGNLGTYTSALGAGAVGTYGLFIVGGSGGITPGSTVAGASLKWSATGWASAIVPSGTWQLMGAVKNADGADTDSVTLCLRIA